MPRKPPHWAGRSYGASVGRFGIIVAGYNEWMVPMTQVDDLSRSFIAFDQTTSLTVVVEMSSRAGWSLEWFLVSSASR